MRGEKVNRVKDRERYKQNWDRIFARKDPQGNAKGTKVHDDMSKARFNDTELEDIKQGLEEWEDAND